MGNCIRSCVSKKKKRIIIPSDGTDKETGLHSHNGCNLDMSLIHKRVLAMGFPSTGFESCYRNPRDEVVEFLDENFGPNYRCYNLCSETDRQYDPAVFHGRVSSSVQWPDHLPPTVRMLKKLVLEDALLFLNKDSKNVVAINCKAGKGRTGTAICCVLLALGGLSEEGNGIVTNDESKDNNTTTEATAASTSSPINTTKTNNSTSTTDPQKVIDFYGRARTSNGKGVTIASQKRYIEYFSQVVNEEREKKQNNNNDTSITTTTTSIINHQQKLRISSLSVRGYKVIHIIRRDPETGKTVDVHTFSRELERQNNKNDIDENDSTDTDAEGSIGSWFSLPKHEPIEPMNSTNQDNDQANKKKNKLIDDISQVELTEDFCIAFSNEFTFPPSSSSNPLMLLWLNGDFIEKNSNTKENNDDNQNDDDNEESTTSSRIMTFTIGEVDGNKAFYDPKNWNKDLVKISFK